jgi:hypothetical protein
MIWKKSGNKGSSKPNFNAKLMEKKQRESFIMDAQPTQGWRSL